MREPTVTDQPFGVLDQEGDPQLLVDERGCVRDINPAGCHLLQRPHRHLVGKPFVVYVDHVLRPVYFDLLRQARHDSTQGGLVRGRLQLPSGGAVEVDLVFAPLDRPRSGAVLILRPTGNDERLTPFLERERRHREMLVAITETLRPPSLAYAGVDLAYKIHGPDAMSRLGGDLCDWLELPSGDLYLAVIDAEGQGALALRVALTVASTLRTLAVMDCPITDMIARAEQLVEAQEPGYTAAVTVLRYDPERALLRVSRAGDPPPLLLRSNGTVERIGDSARPLGFGGKPRSQVTDLEFSGGEVLLVYTDGLLVGHPTPAAGVAALERQLRELHHGQRRGTSAGDIAGRTIAGATRGDDALVAVLRRADVPPLATSDTGAEVFRATLRPPVEHGLDDVRHRLRLWAGHHAVTTQAMHDLLLVVTELGENAIRAARSSVDIEVRRGAGVLDVEVVDDGPGLQQGDLWGPADEGITGGYGLHIVELICTDLQLVPSAAGTVVRGRLRADAGH